MATVPMVQKAWLYKEYGPNEVLSFVEDVKVPKPAPDEVLVKVHAASLNPIDTHRRSGVYPKIGAADSPLPTVPGFDLAGVIVKVGSGVSKFKVGDKVYSNVNEFAMRNPKQYGTFTEYCAVEERLVAEIPKNLSFAEAASLPVAIETAYQALEFAGLQEGGNVLILGGAGGVGSLAVQLAKHVFKAAKVAATTSTPKVDFLKGLGADVVIDYRKEDLKDHPDKYDIVIDLVGKGETTLALKENGKGVLFNGQAQPPLLNFGMVSKAETLVTLKPYLLDGVVKPILDAKGPFKFSEVAEAWAYLDSGRATGKLVISPIP
ncbi:unnamed protein product [Calypogeia fissa]